MLRQVKFGRLQAAELQGDGKPKFPNGKVKYASMSREHLSLRCLQGGAAQIQYTGQPVIHLKLGEIQLTKGKWVDIENGDVPQLHNS